ncbi:MAG: hypothetical protein P4L53_23590 [Candidatus Obscuribacterales bacterium]|nr:hypothetical protein [Candidatus Obscuribacterales bacterium]
MHNALLCQSCRAEALARDDATVSDAIIASGNVIFVCGINYAAFEEKIRPVFSQMPSNFEKHSGACFLRYQSGGSHNYDFTLVVVGEDNEKGALLLLELVSRSKRFVIIVENELMQAGGIGDEDLATLQSFPDTTVSLEKVGDGAADFAGAMKHALKAVSRD